MIGSGGVVGGGLCCDLGASYKKGLGHATESSVGTQSVIDQNGFCFLSFYEELAWSRWVTR